MKYLITFLIALTTFSCTAKNPEPASLAQNLLTQEKATQSHAKIALAMHCFWTGERKLGAIDGVILTEAGWLGDHEVTLVTYDKSAIKIEALIKKATAIECANKVYVPKDQIQTAKASTRKSVAILTGYTKAQSSDQKKQLQGTSFAKLKLTPAQATKVNSHARTNPSKAKAYLTKQQLNAL